MTSKEFSRKIEFYRAYAGAIHLFSDFSSGASVKWCWKVTCIGVDGETFTHFTKSLDQDKITWYQSFFELRSIWIDRFTYAEFFTQVCYFKSFVAKTSDYQYAVLQQDSDMRKLLDYIKGFEI